MTEQSLFARILTGWRRLRRDHSGIAFVEFGLMLPLFVSVSISGMEIANYTLANTKVQRMAVMVADLVAQSGAGEIGVTEQQIYDLFNAVDVSAQPYDLRNRGRVVITAVMGVDPNPADNATVVVNRILWQRFDGDYVAAVPQLGCHTTNNVAVLPNNRQLALNELMFHAQVTYEYEPLFPFNFPQMLSLPTTFTRVAVFRGRSREFQIPTPLDDFPPKQNCTSADGL